MNKQFFFYGNIGRENTSDYSTTKYEKLLTLSI